MVTRLGVRGQGRLANQRASPSAHVGAVNDEKDDGSATRSEENSSGNDHKLHLSMYGKASQLEKQMGAKLAWLREKYSHRTREDVVRITHPHIIHAKGASMTRPCYLMAIKQIVAWSQTEGFQRKVISKFHFKGSNSKVPMP
ncbi:hypothetical protein Tco_1031281 [Tanacetum coccineum]|uniref:Uncharacterized protein n=1 Tax=Tanacetum coccineum TaxID=301880 RepID=A0ABQ5G916_9ASTR